jgi:hypothetical protein
MIMMNLCLECTRKELLKMYHTITKFETKEFTRLGEILPNCLKRPNEDAVEDSPKRITSPKNHKQPMGMPLVKPIFPKKEIYELNNNEDFSSIRIVIKNR